MNPLTYSPTHLLTCKRAAFTLAEVLITLAIVGVVAVLTIPPLVTKIANKGYTERLKKTYSVLQNVTNMIVAEEGDPINWGWTAYRDSDSKGNARIVDLYRKHLKISDYCPLPPNGDNDKANRCRLARADYFYLNGGVAGDCSQFAQPLFYSSNIFILSDGVTVGVRFLQTNLGITWGIPDLLFTIDVNGKQPPNTIGRDIFFLYMKKNEHGRIRPYANEKFREGGVDFRNTCSTDSYGHSCAYRILVEDGGKMLY